MKKQVFAHDIDARNNPELKKVLLRYGMAGIGIFWSITEMLYEKDGVIPMDAIDNMASEFRCRPSVVRSVVCDFNLFVNDGSDFWSESVKDTLEHRKRISEARSAAGRKGGAPKGNKNAANEKDAEPAGQQEQPAQVQPKPEEKQPEQVIMQPVQVEQKPEQAQEPAQQEKQPEQEKPVRKIFKKPTIEDVQEEINRKGYDIDAKAFIAFYESKGWMIGKNHMKSWKAALVTWQHRRDKESNTKPNNNINDLWK